MNLYDYQNRVAKLIQAGKSVILQAPTGAGKTLASLWPFIEAWEAGDLPFFPRKCIYGVPMRVLANQFSHDTNELIATKLVLTKPPQVKIQTGERPQDREFRADMIFATIDQMLSSWLLHPYGLPGRLGNINAGALVGSYLVFDEFHLFDPDSTLPTTLQMLKMLKGISPFVLMTATFSAEMLVELADLLDAEPILLSPADLAEIPAQNKERRYYVADQPLWADGEPFIEPVLAAHEHEKRSLVVFNQVERAQRFYEALLEAAPAGTEIRLLHSRFRQEDRQRIEEEIRREFGKKTEEHTLDSLILVGTQVVEVGLDMSCTNLHTELAPASSILQRAGRCARYEGESGRVTLYPVENNRPYSGKLTKPQCESTWAWFQTNQDRHLTFADEQALINHVHTPADRQILDGLQVGKGEWQMKIEDVWRGNSSRVEVRDLIRNIQSQSFTVTSDPDAIRHAPFEAELFSLHPGTIKGRFEEWQEQAKDTFEREDLPFAVCCLEYVEEDVVKEGRNRPGITYAWKNVTSKELLGGTSLLAIHPDLVGYRPDLGLTLYAGDRWETVVPPKKSDEPRWHTQYKKETYNEHIRLVLEAFGDGGMMAEFRPAAAQLERAFGWSAGTLLDLVYRVIWLHDTGKLTRGWQKWAQNWQAQPEIGNAHPLSPALAHTDYDSSIPAQKDLNRRLGGKRPPHALESAMVASFFLLEQYGKPDNPLFQAGFSAIARHHGPFSQQFKSYALVDYYEDEIGATGRLLPPHLAQPLPRTLHPALTVDNIGGQHVVDQLLTNPAHRAAMCAYFLLVRALRLSDQEGTKRGAQ